MQTPVALCPEPAREILDVLPADALGEEASVLGLAELLLKAPQRVDQLVRDEQRQPLLIGRLLALALAAFALYAVTLVALLQAVPRTDLPWPLQDRWDGTAWSAVGLGLAYPIGLVAATGICLPSFYFLALLAGVRVSWLQMTNQILKGKASTAILLIGVLPIYVALMLGLLIFEGSPEWVRGTIELGLALPFLCGVWGAWSILQSVRTLGETMRPERRCARECFLRRLTLSWAAVYLVVSPVMIYTLWDHLTRY